MVRNEINILDFAQKVGTSTPDWSDNGKVLTEYMVPIDKLYYNDTNGRIATYISGYYDQNRKDLNELDIKEYNRIIEEYIKLSNIKGTFQKTYEDIKIKGQIQPGVILADGRVVSGNRRFTVLRNLYKDTGQDKFRYFKCYILDKSLSTNDQKYIKTIERLTQFGVDEKVGYDSISRLVDIYNDLIGPNKLWEVEEYAKKLSLKINEVKLMYYKAIIMIDYLEYIDKPLKFHIASSRKLDGPFQELANLYKTVERDEWNRIRIVLYSQLLEKGDKTREVRALIRIYKNAPTTFDSLIEKCQEDLENQEIEHISKNNNEINLENDKITKVSHKTQTDIYLATSEAKEKAKTKRKIKSFMKSLNSLNEIKSTFKIMDKTEKKECLELLRVVEKSLETFMEDVNEFE